MISCHLLQTCTRDRHSCIRRAGLSSGQDTQNANISRRTLSGRVSIVSAGLSQNSTVRPSNSVLYSEFVLGQNRTPTTSARHSRFWKSVLVFGMEEEQPGAM